MTRTQALSSPNSDAPDSASRDETPAEALLSVALLSVALPGERVRIVSIAQEEDLAAWLRAVGMHEDAEVLVLRRAPFGGPLHLRTSDGGEFAIHRDLARCIHVTPLPRETEA